jgi:membrane associated rhomboid family serine protease
VVAAKSPLLIFRPALNFVAMLEDRDYMREPEYRESRVSFTVVLLIVNAVCFIIQLAASSSWNHVELHDSFQATYFALSLDGLEHGFVWQLLTFQFMHANWTHIIFNSLAIYFFGRPVEDALGRRHFLTLYLSAGIIGGLVQMLFTALVPAYFNLPVVGASAGASGLVAAFAILHWEERFTLLIFFILPVNMTGKMLLAASLLLTFGAMFFTPNSGIANAAHLGGILTGAYYVRLFIQGQWPRWKFPARRAAPRDLAIKRAGKGALWHSAADKPNDESTDEFLKNEVDPILEKISAHGIQSLTAREREILEKARTRMAKH